MNTAPFWDYVIEKGTLVRHSNVSVWAEVYYVDDGDGVGVAISLFVYPAFASGDGYYNGITPGNGTGYQNLVYNHEAEALILF